jgi:hypothetical protein
VAPRGRSSGRRYVSAGELADYAFCPRSHYYARHPDGRSVAADSLARERAGTRYHARTIGSDRRWGNASALPWIAALLIGAALLAAVILRWPL